MPLMEKRVNIHIPPGLKKQLIDDWECVTHLGQVINISLYEFSLLDSCCHSMIILFLYIVYKLLPIFDFFAVYRLIYLELVSANRICGK